MSHPSQQTILLVEDYKDSREMLSLLLEDLKYRVLATVNGQHALDLASKETPDLILTDFNLPDMNGTELIRRIRRLGGRLSHIPIVMLTAYGRDVVRDLAIEAGCTAFFSKPINFTILQEAIEQLLVEAREINGSVNDH
jgi:CheY-like chemotaxis protein